MTDLAIREGNPGLMALPLVIAVAAAAAVPILLSANQNVNATFYGSFFGFYASYAVLSLGVTHDWLGSWLLTIGLLTGFVVAFVALVG